MKMVQVNHEQHSDTVQKLMRKAGGCISCIQRLVPSSSDVEAPLQSDAEAEEECSNAGGCCICLGMLDNSTVNKTVDQVITSLREEKYTCADFQLCVSIPQVINLRQASMGCYVERNVEGFPALNKTMTAVKEVFKSRVAKRIGEQMQMLSKENSDLSVNISMIYDGDKAEIKPLNDLLPETSSDRKRKHWKQARWNVKQQSHQIGSLQAINSAIERITSDNVDSYTSCPPTSVADGAVTGHISTKHQSIYVAGRYNKYSRELSQTPWTINGERKGITSVQELICSRLEEISLSKEVKFISSGREDIDVLMLGTGRPFAVEMVDPHQPEALRENISDIENYINKSSDKISVSRLCVVDKASLSQLKEGEESKTKTYRAQIWSPEEISLEMIDQVNTIKDLKLDQDTPLRVLHRRSLATRTKMIHWLCMTPQDSAGHYTLELETQAGTYVKEFVHGDFGRTRPSLGGLLQATDVDIIELDVMGVELEWPPLT